jgi:hypothetical protein
MKPYLIGLVSPHYRKGIPGAHKKWVTSAHQSGIGIELLSTVSRHGSNGSLGAYCCYTSFKGRFPYYVL